MTHTTPPKLSGRILSIDVMRGFTLLLMLFVNDLYEPGVPHWMVHTKATVDGMGLADWVFPGFLFMVGLSVPFAFASRRKRGDTNSLVFRHLIIRTISLLIIGVLMLNVGRLNPELTGMNKFVWAILVYLCIFLVWNKYPETSVHQTYFFILKALGIVGLLALVAVFRAGNPENISWLQIGWWGILGLIGWGYFAASMTYLLVGKRLISVVAVWCGFVLLNVFSQLDLLGFLDPLKGIFGVLISGNTPSIVFAGLVFGMLLKQHRSQPFKIIKLALFLGILSLIIGLVLRNWFIISKIEGTPSWAMVCNGISLLVFALLFGTIDVWKQDRWFRVFLPAGQNSLTTYLAPDVIYYLIWGLSFPILFYKQDSSQLLAVVGSLVWAFAMVGLAALLAKLHVRLKL